MPFVVPEILRGCFHPLDTIKLSEKADAINRYYSIFILTRCALLSASNWNNKIIQSTPHILFRKLFVRKAGNANVTP